MAEALEPKRPPFYISGSGTGHPDGWYWVPANGERPVFLGRNVIWAERKLIELNKHANATATV